MTTKEKLLAYFEAHRGIFYSGQQLAENLGVSRTAIWKGVQSLREEGYAITAVTNRGYCFSEDTDILSSQGIRKYLSNPSLVDLTVLSVVTSTNLLLKEKADAGALQGTCVIAGEQTKGRGRRQRSFYSPANTGVYLSLLLRPENRLLSETVHITTMAAVAMCEAIESISGQNASIKWVNDIFLGDKKVCGILTEASLNMENGRVAYAVLGAGVNVYLPEGGFPEEVKDVATAIFSSPQKDAKNRLASAFLQRFFAYYEQEDSHRYVEEYRRRCFVLGKAVQVWRGDKKTDAYAIDIDEACHLLVRYDDGSEEALSSGEVSVRMND